MELKIDLQYSRTSQWILCGLICSNEVITVIILTVEREDEIEEGTGCATDC